MRRLALPAVAALLLPATALAHTPYLKPTTFAAERPYVSAEAALTEATFFVPDFPIRGPDPFLITGPSGETGKATNAVQLKEFTAVEFALPDNGTYRLSTGERAGRAGKWAKVDGTWRMVRPGGAPAGGEGGGRSIDEAAIPAGAETMTSTIYIRADTYVSRGPPSRGALKPTGQGFEVEPVSHPNETFAGDAFKFRMLNDGKPLPGVEFNVARAGDAYAEKRFSHAGKTDAAGAAAVTLAEPGVYILEAHYPARAEGAAVPIPRSTAYTLTFEVTR